MKIVNFSLENGNKYYGKIDGNRFYIGSRVSYLGNKGLMNTKGKSDQRYDSEMYRDKYGFWADFIHPTSMAEGALFHTLNTYDRAHFTFTFMQFAAHVPDGDFVEYFRALLGLPLAAEYFPDLTVENGRICRLTDDGVVNLESSSSTHEFMNYLNPSVEAVEDTEVIQAAKLIHWVQNDPLHRDLQIDIGIKHIKKRVHSYARRYHLDGVDDRICLVIADIRHQGRAKSTQIISALQSSNPLNALLKIGDTEYRQRLVTLRKEINRLTDEGRLGIKSYSLQQEDFV